MFVCLVCLWFDVVLVLFFFFKQKTAYEMRISDWSSDVCPSDLVCPQFGENPSGIDQCLGAAERNHAHLGRIGKLLFHEPGAPDRRSRAIWREGSGTSARSGHDLDDDVARLQGLCLRLPEAETRSEEHTSELQSLMRISYADFCLKTKKHRQT